MKGGLGHWQRRVTAIACAAVLGYGGCAPVLDWREFRPPGAPLVALFPCKPDGHARELALAGGTVKWTLHACRAADISWALAWGDVHDPARVAAALRGLRASTQANLSASSMQPRSLSVAGATPQPDGGRWSLVGQALDGRALQAELALFSRGTVLFQATAMGPASSGPFADAAGTFLDSLRLGP